MQDQPTNIDPASFPEENKSEGRWRYHVLESMGIWLLRLFAYFSFGVGLLLFGTVFFKGIQGLRVDSFPYFDTNFLTESPESLYLFEFNGTEYTISAGQIEEFLKERNLTLKDIDAEIYSYAGGGILPAIGGTIFLVMGSLFIALMLGISAAIFLSEYSRTTRFLEIIRLAIVNLAGVPSIIYGLFGFGVFVLYFGWGQSLIAGWFTLGILALPLVIRASEEALQMVPRSVREASLALGATRWQTIFHNVLPQAFPGILTASILSIVRVAGETAPILFTTAFAFRAALPWEAGSIRELLSQGVMALPYHLFIVTTRLPVTEATQKAQYGTAMVFILVLFFMTAFSLFWRGRIRNRMKIR